MLRAAQADKHAQAPASEIALPGSKSKILNRPESLLLLNVLKELYAFFPSIGNLSGRILIQTSSV
jgi:hypothetical protein